MNTVHVALCFSDASGSYYKHALVTAASVLANTNSPVTLHLVHDETLGAEAKNAFEALCAARGQRLRLHAAGDIPAETERNVLSKLGRGALFRTMLPKLLEEEKILYLDCDVVCNLDVAELWGMDLTGHYLGALPLTGEQARLHRGRLGLRGNICINSGVMLMNLLKIRRNIPDYAERLFAIVREHKRPIGDQGAANIFFDGTDDAFLFLPECYNFRTGQKDNATLPMGEYSGKIIHFVGRKPWVELSTPGLWYWKYYAELFPEDDAFARMASLEAYEHEYLLSFLLRRDSLRRCVNRLYEINKNGFWGMLKGRIAK